LLELLGRVAASCSGTLDAVASLVKLGFDLGRRSQEVVLFDELLDVDGAGVLLAKLRNMRRYLRVGGCDHGSSRRILAAGVGAHRRPHHGVATQLRSLLALSRGKLSASVRARVKNHAVGHHHVSVLTDLYILILLLRDRAGACHPS